MQLFSHFQQCYQCLLSYAQVINVLEYDTAPQEFSFIIIDLWVCQVNLKQQIIIEKEDIYICHLKVHDKT